MSFSLAIVDGDLAPQGGQLQIVYGVDKLKQDMDCWVRERIGVDRFHPRYGSQLEDFIGGIIGPDTSHEIAQEILRVLHNYQAVLLQALKQDPQSFSLSELLMDITSVSATSGYDTVNASIVVVNGERAPVTVKTSNTTVGA